MGKRNYKTDKNTEILGIDVVETDSVLESELTTQDSGELSSAFSAPVIEEQNKSDELINALKLENEELKIQVKNLTEACSRLTKDLEVITARYNKAIRIPI